MFTIKTLAAFTGEIDPWSKNSRGPEAKMTLKTGRECKVDTSYKATVTEAVRAWHGTGTQGSGLDLRPRGKPSRTVPWFLTIPWGKNGLFHNGAGTAGWLHAEERYM